MKAHGFGGYVAVAFAYVYACGGSPAPSSSPSTADDAGVAESGGGGGDGSGLELDAHAGAGDGALDGSDRSDGGAQVGAGDDATNAPSANASQYCCMSGAYYACPADAALSQCAGTSVPSGCTRDSTYDSACLVADGGASSVNGSSNSSSTSNVQPPTPVKNSCGGLFAGGLACGAGGSCLSGHCAGGSCYPNDVGNPCTYGNDNDCGQGNHCTNGCCQSPAKGSPCSAFWDCTSNSCTNGVCQ